MAINEESRDEERIKRRHSLSRFLEKIKPKRKQKIPSLGFLSHRASISSISSQISEEKSKSTASLLTSELNVPSSVSASVREEENFITLGTFNCVLATINSAIQGRLYLADKFFVFDSKTLSSTYRVRLDWIQILSIKMNQATQEIQFIAIKGRFRFGRFLVSEPLSEIFKLLQTTWKQSIEGRLRPTVSARRPAFPTASQFLLGPRWSCGCYAHYPFTSEKYLVDTVPLEAYKRIFSGEEEPFFIPERVGTERSLVTPLDNCFVRERLVIKKFSADLIRVELAAYVANEEGEERIIINGKWCIVIREDKSGFVTQVILSFQQMEPDVAFKQIINRYLEEFEVQFPDSAHFDSPEDSKLGWKQLALMSYYFYALPVLAHYKLISIGVLCYLLGWLIKSMIPWGEEPLFIDNTTLIQQESMLTDLLTGMQKNVQQLINSLQN